MVPWSPRGQAVRMGLSAQDQGMYSSVPGGGFRGEPAGLHSQTFSLRNHGISHVKSWISQMNFSSPLGFFLCICGIYVGMYVHMCTHE